MIYYKQNFLRSSLHSTSGKYQPDIFCFNFTKVVVLFMKPQMAGNANFVISQLFFVRLQHYDRINIKEIWLVNSYHP